MSKYWEIGEKNKFGKECYKLHFTQFYDDEVVAGFVQDEEDDNVFIYTSKEMNVEYDTIIADSIEDAKEQIEEMLVEHWNDEINYLENQLLGHNTLRLYQECLQYLSTLRCGGGVEIELHLREYNLGCIQLCVCK